MSKHTLKTVLTNFCASENPFVFFRLPNTEKVHCFHQKNTTVHCTDDLNCNGFIFSPFQKTNKKTFYIPDTHRHTFHEIPPSVQPQQTTSFKLEQDKFAFISLIRKAKQAIEITKVEKIVVSRQIKVSIKANLIQTFISLLHAYPQAFVYLWHHPKTGTWFGATPEQLIVKKDDMFSTMALAGTKPFKGTMEVQWGEKEKREQQLVTNQIAEDLLPFFQKKDIVISKPFTVKAGNLLHLCTTFHFPTSQNITSILEKLHPTPAIGGTPKKEALKFLKNEENYNREYYTGFLGVLNKKWSGVYVNLRCAKYQPNVITLYVGAGVTVESKQEKEWEETVQKAHTILSILKKE